MQDLQQPEQADIAALDTVRLLQELVSVQDDMYQVRMFPENPYTLANNFPVQPAKVDATRRGHARIPLRTCKGSTLLFGAKCEGFQLDVCFDVRCNIINMCVKRNLHTPLRE